MALKKFHFTTLSENKNRLSGYLFAENEVVAREKLKKEGVVILSIEPYEEKPLEDPELIRFEFEATDSTGKIVHGDIEEKSDYEAYKKLKQEYNFTIVSLVKKDLPYEEKQRLKGQGISSEFEQRLEEENKANKIEKPKEDSQNKSQKKSENNIESILKANQEEINFIQKEIVIALEEVQNVLDKHGQYIEDSKKKEIQDNLDELSRLRHSNSIQHLKNVMENLFDIIASDDIFISVQEGEFIPDLERHKVAVKRIAQKLKSQLKKKLMSIKIDPEKWKFLLSFNIFQKISRTIQPFFIMFFAITLLFFLFNGGKLIFGMDSEKAQFYLTSSSLWFMAGLSAVIFLFLFLQSHLEKDLPLSQKLLFYGSSILVILLFIIEFPLLFFWTN